ncbi:MAG: HPr family phosphocarrier protein [Chloroflexota bacterium]|nr:HPr family phosphocarrier protein [Chloroflexota bacterium]
MIVSTTITTTHAVGLHDRPATLFARMAQNYTAEIIATFDGKAGHTKGLPSLLSLSAMQDSCIAINADGDGGEDPVAALAALVADNFGE